MNSQFGFAAEKERQNIQWYRDINASRPNARFQYEVQQEHLGLRGAIGLQGFLDPRLASERVWRRWVEQGIWSRKWVRLDINFFVGEKWKHEEPLELDSESESSSTASSLRIGRVKKAREVQRKVDRRLKREREREASRPYQQFVYQISSKSADEKKNALNDTAHINTRAYELVKIAWIKQGIWNTAWGVLPGMEWKHEDPAIKPDTVPPTQRVEDWILRGRPAFERHLGESPSVSSMMNPYQMTTYQGKQEAGHGPFTPEDGPFTVGQRANTTQSSEQSLFPVKQEVLSTDEHPPHRTLGIFQHAAMLNAYGTRKAPQQRPIFGQPKSPHPIPPFHEPESPRKSKRIKQQADSEAKEAKPEQKAAESSLFGVPANPSGPTKPQGILRKQTKKFGF